MHVLFDRYDELSLKSKTREDRSSGIQIQYRVEDDTSEITSALRQKSFYLMLTRNEILPNI